MFFKSREINGVHEMKLHCLWFLTLGWIREQEVVLLIRWCDWSIRIFKRLLLLVMKTFVHLSKRMLTQVSALTLVRSSCKMKRTEQQLCPISERCVPCFRERRRTVRWWWLCETLSIPRSVTLHSVCFLKSRDSVTAVQLSYQHMLLQIVWKQQLHRHTINESKLRNTL